MNSVITKIVIFVVSAFILIMVGSQIFFAMSHKQHTEEAILYTTTNTLNFDGVFVRNETVIPYSGSGVLNYENEDGSKIAKNSVVAQIVSDSGQIEIRKKITELESQLALLERATNPGTTEAAQPEFISKQIDEKYILLLKYTETGDISKAEATKSEIQVLMNIYNIATQTESKEIFAQKKSSINTEIAQLKSQLTAPIEEIKTQEPGYFVSFADGYESRLNFDTINTLTASDIKAITSSDIKKDATVVGKTFNDYKWKITGIVTADDDLIKGKNVNMYINGSSMLIPAFVDDMKHIDGNQYIVILSTSVLNVDFAKERVREVSIILNEYTGIKIPRTAITFEGGQKGVNVMYGQKKMFKKLDVIYEGDGYVISQKGLGSDYVSVHDQLVFEEAK